MVELSKTTAAKDSNCIEKVTIDEVPMRMTRVEYESIDFAKKTFDILSLHNDWRVHKRYCIKYSIYITDEDKTIKKEVTIDELVYEVMERECKRSMLR